MYPSVDPRRARQLVADLQRMAHTLVPEWHGSATDGDAGLALLRIAAHFAEHVTQRLDRTPKRDTLAFFNFLDLPRETPRAAAVPLVFTLAEGRETPVYAPARLQAAATADGDEIIFETRDALSLTPARLTSITSVDTNADRIEEAPTGFLELKPPGGDPQRFVLASFADQGSETVQITPSVGIRPDDDLRIDGSVYRVGKDEGGGIFALRDRLEAPAEAGTPVEKVTTFDMSRLRNVQEHVVYVGHSELLNLRQPALLTLVVVPGSVATRLSNLGLEYELWGTREGASVADWQPLTLVSAGSGVVRLRKDWAGNVDETEVSGDRRRWLRLRLPGPIGGQASFGTLVGSLQLQVAAVQPPVSSAEGSRTITKALSNNTPLPLTTRFFPFGSEPQRFDIFALAAPEALSKKGASVTLTVQLVDATAAIFAVPLTLSAALAATRAYTIARNGRLQALALSQGKIGPWQELGNPSALSGADAQSLRLDQGFAPLACETSTAGTDLIVARDRGQRYWVTQASATASPLGRFIATAWQRLPALPEGVVSSDAILLPFVVPLFQLRFNVVLVATTEGLFLLFLDDAGRAYGDEWLVLRSAAAGQQPEQPVFSDLAGGSGDVRRVRLVTVLPSEWPTAPDIPFDIIVLDVNGALWSGQVSLSQVTWERLTDDGTANLEVQPVAAAVDENRFVVFAADEQALTLLAMIKTKDSVGIETIDGPSTFRCQLGTMLLCVPRYRISADQPIVVAFGTREADGFSVETVALWGGEQEINAIERPLGSNPRGVLLPAESDDKAPTLVLAGEQETLFHSVLPGASSFQGAAAPLVQTSLPRPLAARLGIEAAASPWLSVQFERRYQNPALSWEYFDGSGWRRVETNFADTTDNFASSGEISFQVPDDIATTDVAGQQDYWLRARLVGGDYGRPHYIVTSGPGSVAGTTTQTIEVDTSQLNPPEILSIEASFSLSTGQQPERVLTANNLTVLDQTQANNVQGAVFELLQGALAIDSEAAGRTLYLGFSRAFNIRPLNLFVDAEERDRRLDVTFEVFSSAGWQAVAASDETLGLHRRGFVQVFIDVEPTRARLFNRENFWLRVRPRDVVSDWSPHLLAVFINAGRAEQAQTIEQEVLGSSDGSPDQRFRLSQAPVLQEELEIRVRETLGSEERASLEAIPTQPTLVATYPSNPDMPGTWVLWTPTDSFVGQGSDARVFLLDAPQRANCDAATTDRARSRLPILTAFEPSATAAGEAPKATLILLRFRPLSRLSSRSKKSPIRLPPLAARMRQPSTPKYERRRHACGIMDKR